MKKNIKVFGAVLVVLALVITAYFGTKSNSKNQSQSTEETVSDKKTLIVGTSAQTFPNSFKNESGELTGFDVELTEAIADKLGYSVQWEIIGDVPGLLSALDAGKIDTVANAITILPERKEKYDFSTPVGYYAAQIAVKNDSDYDSVSDLEGKTVSATLGSSNVTLLETYNSKVNIQTYDDRSAIFTDANNGTVDGVVNQKQFLEKTIEEQNLDLRIIDEVIGWNESAFPFSKTEKGKTLTEEFNNAIKELQEDGTLETISQKYYGEDITKKAE
ncbi:TPA: transporter substrate-binding domain-containing protein [Streptococcus suis]|nr:transporter substrate-binding domain-containing protein [Streptococcus suis]